MSTDAMPADATATSTVTDPAAAAERRARASVAFGRKRGYYRLLFDSGSVDVATFARLAEVPERNARAWLAEQVAAGVLRVVPSPDGDRDELLLPGEFVPILLGDGGEAEFAGARALLAESRDELPRVLETLRAAPRAAMIAASTYGGIELERVRAAADVVRLSRVL